jgi:hypothetical protein
MCRNITMISLALLPMLLPTIAKADSWCIRDSAGVTSAICAFSSADDCIRAALVGPSGGIVCARESSPAAEGGGNPVKHYSPTVQVKKRAVRRRKDPRNVRVLTFTSPFVFQVKPQS